MMERPMFTALEQGGMISGLIDRETFNDMKNGSALTGTAMEADVRSHFQSCALPALRSTCRVIFLRAQLDHRSLADELSTLRSTAAAG